MILEDIERKLTEIDENVFYGSNFDVKKLTGAYNYIVFGRSELRAATNRTGYVDTFWVAVAREGWIPDGLPEQIIDAMESLPGVRFIKDNAAEYDYATKPNTTSLSIEMLRLNFTRARK